MDRFVHRTRRAASVVFLIAAFALFAHVHTALFAQEGSDSPGAENAETGEAAGAETGAVAGTWNDPVRVAVLNNFPPFSFDVRGKIMGFTIDYLKLLEEKIGVPLKMIPGTWEDNLRKFKRGDVDLITAISYTEDRTAFTHYSKPYYLIPTVVYIREESFSYEGVEISSERPSALRGAEKLAEAIRGDIEEHAFPVDRKITVSVGVAECDKNHDVEELIRRADSYLYEAKEEGKNRVVSGR